ncbi:MAG: hypothetical protein NWE98_00470 [Candidatus Bathyarchaeota archaeon]|nr:hypothetical protein [Candidatus Bathyarchaeota archaeon]
MKKIDNLREIFQNTKHRRPCHIYCPRCASPKIQLNSSLAVWLTPKQYYCPECGYIGTIVMELEEDPQTNQEKTET